MKRGFVLRLLGILLLACFCVGAALLGGAAARYTAENRAEAVDALAEFRTERASMREDAIAQTGEMMQDESIDAATREAAARLRLKLLNWTEIETTLEGQIRAMGFADALVTVHDDSATVLVRAESLSRAESALILDSVCRETNLTGGEVRIIPVE